MFNKKLINSLQDEIEYLKKSNKSLLALLFEIEKKELSLRQKNEVLCKELKEKTYVSDTTHQSYRNAQIKCNKKISELECENKFLTETSKELSKLLSACLSKEDLNKNIEHIEWYPVSIRPTKEEYYLARATTSLHNETIYCGSKYNFSAGWCGLAPFTVTHWAKVEGPKL